MPQKLIVEVIGDSRSYERALTRSSVATKKFNADITKTATAGQALRGALSTTPGGSGGFLFGSSAFVGSAIAAGVISKSVAAASDLNEQLSRTQVVMGDAADEMIKWSETTASSIGISQRAALTASATFAGLFQVVGVGQKDAGKMSQVLVKLAADLASLQNADPSETLIALRSGLAGEAEPLRRFNIFLSEARVQQEALSETGKTSIKTLTQQEKTLARYNLILKDGAIANDNFSLTAGGLANQQRTLKAETDDLAASLGKALVPTLQGLTAVLIGAVGGTNDFIGAMGDLREKLKDSHFADGWNKAIEDATDGTSDFFQNIRDNIPILSDLREAVQGAFEAAPAPTRRGHGAGGRPSQTPHELAVANAKAAADAIARATRRANASLDQQISDSAARIGHLQDLIRADPSNEKLQKRLTDEIKKQNVLLAQRKTLNESNARSAAAAAKSAHDAAVQAAADRKQAQKDANERRNAAEVRRQFKAIGLTAEGLKLTPGTGSLLQRTLGLKQQIKGTVLDTPKTKKQLDQIRDFLKKNMGKVKRDVRAAILDMLNGISDAMEGKGAKTGPLTKTHGIRSAQIIKNLGLSQEQADEIQRRLAHGTTTVGRSRTNAPGASKVPGQRGPQGQTFTANVNVYIDGKKVANTVTRSQQKDKRRNPRQKRGTHRN